MTSLRRRAIDAGSRPRRVEPAGEPGAPRPHPERRFLLVFAAVASGLFMLYRWSEEAHLYRHVNELNALVCGGVLRLLRVPNIRLGATLELSRGRFDVISECSAVYIGILYTAAVLAFPAPWRARARGLAVGLPFVFVVNVLRLASLGALLVRRPAWLPFFHGYLWQVLFIGIAAALYVAWLGRGVPRARARAAAPVPR